MPKITAPDLQKALSRRFGDAPRLESDTSKLRALARMATRGSCRSFLDKPVPAEWVQAICATALSAPSKSDLQQRDIILLQSQDTRAKLAALVKGQAWVADAPMIAVICGNNRRQRLLHDWHGVPFANDHLDAFFNATGDAAIALGAFVTAAEAIGLGCCPISGVRNDPAAVADLLGLPDHVFPFAGIAFGFPAAPSQISMRLPLRVTCHVDRYQEDDLRFTVSEYNATRAAAQPYETQRDPDRFPPADPYTWAEDKIRQYSLPERSNFGDYIRGCGFNLD